MMGNMLASMLPADVAAQLGPERIERGSQLVSDLVGRVGPLGMIALMGELLVIQGLLESDVPAAAQRAHDLAVRYDAHDLAAYLTELAGNG